MYVVCFVFNFPVTFIVVKLAPALITKPNTTELCFNNVDTELELLYFP